MPCSPMLASLDAFEGVHLVVKVNISREIRLKGRKMKDEITVIKVATNVHFIDLVERINW